MWWWWYKFIYKFLVYNISYVSQNVVLFDDTIKNNIIFGKSFDKTKFNDVIKKSQLIFNKKHYQWKKNLKLVKEG